MFWKYVLGIMIQQDSVIPLFLQMIYGGQS